MKRNEKIILGGWLGILIAILLIVITISGCRGSWSVANLEITPLDNQDSLYLVIIDQDSTTHWYNGAIYVEENYCYKHHIWEDVRKKNSE
tara:strand:+ start:97 stop:366 length:270 start_codon:yes stop_codon:yes gene_type:complete